MKRASTVSRRLLLASLLGFALMVGGSVVTHAQPSNGVARVRMMDPCKNPGGDPKCDIPQAPGSPVGLPLVGLVVLGGAAWRVRRRASAPKRKIER